MTALLATNPVTSNRASRRDRPQRIAVARAVLALVWAAVVILVVGDRVPGTDSDVPAAAAALLAFYPLIDVVASLAAGAGDRLQRLNALISATAAGAIGVAAFGSDAGATLVAFGAWAAVSGALLLGMTVRRRRAEGRQVPMLISGGLSTIAGLSIAGSAGSDDAHLAMLGGYMAAGAVLYLVSVFPDRRA